MTTPSTDPAHGDRQGDPTGRTMNTAFCFYLQLVPTGQQNNPVLPLRK
jgi:hypothetical protein